ncbi:ABC transporter substrate-binding protein [Pseudothauera rhizosphaerae]|uniref:Amino acid ABC transporter substrate-binding protein n=1 Tax=Pseudothauera rhizosphaerae TaxID=2565932 RepID=A0A4S4AR15_9RHOO|nr:ABC transporter substrate-binding protein [Pseudothauera rhizosphaerae]THF62194.1 amino acid ABC transporter substrate-binding protein [Pseudothauera rhizosphaerae]
MRLRFAAALAAVLACAPAAADGRLDRIQTSGTLRVCVWPDYYGVSWRNPQGGELIGIDVDLARELGKELGVAVEFVDSAFSRLFDDVLGGRCDVAMFAIGITPQRQERLRFTSPHLASDIYAITTRSNRRIRSWDDIDRPGVVVAVAKGTLHEPVMRDMLRHAQLAVLDTPHAREQEVESGRADVFMTDYPYSRRMLDGADWARLVSPTATYHVTPYAWALAPGDEVWHQRLEDFVGAIKRDGRLAEAARRHGLEPIVVDH